MGFIIDHVTEHERGPCRPTGHAKGVEIRDQMEVAVAPFPVGVGEPLDWLHLHVDREEVIAPVGAFGRTRLEEERRIEPFPHGPAVVIGEADDDRVDLAVDDGLVQLFESHHISGSMIAQSRRPSHAAANRSWA